MKNFHAPAQRLGKRRRSHRHHHEFLEIDIVIGVRAAVEDVHHRHRQRVRRGPAEIAIEREFTCSCRGAGRRHRNRQDRVRPQPPFVGRAIEFDQTGVERALVGCVRPAEIFRNLAIDIRDRLQNALAEELRLVAVAQFDGLMLAGGRATRHNGSRAGAAIQKNFRFNRRIAPRVKHLASADKGNTCERHKCVLSLLNGFRNLVPNVAVVKVGTRRSNPNSPSFVIPSEARDLHFRCKLQIPRFARDDNS